MKNLKNQAIIPGMAKKEYTTRDMLRTSALYCVFCSEKQKDDPFRSWEIERNIAYSLLDTAYSRDDLPPGMKREYLDKASHLCRNGCGGRDFINRIIKKNFRD